MRKLFLAAVSVVAMTSGAAAADVEPGPEPLAGFDWSGFYIGAHGGFLWGDAEASTGGAFDTEPEGGFGGLNAGWRMQMDPWVFGIGADVSFGSIEDDAPVGFVDQNFDLFGTVHGQLGFAIDRFLLYVLGGVAIAEGERDSAIFGDDSATHFGWVAGFGGDVAVTDLISLFAEYKHLELDEEEYNLGPISVDVDFTADLVMGGARINF